jgi:hypothetical protein
MSKIEMSPDNWYYFSLMHLIDELNIFQELISHRHQVQNGDYLLRSCSNNAGS